MQPPIDPAIRSQVEEFQRELQAMSALYRQAILEMARDGFARKTEQARHASRPPKPAPHRPVWRRLASLVHHHLFRQPAYIPIKDDEECLAPVDITVTIIHPTLIATPPGTLMLPPHHQKTKGDQTSDPAIQ